MEKLNDTSSSPLRYVASDGTVFGQFYNSWDGKYHFAEYVPSKTLPREYLCGGRGNFSPSRREDPRDRCAQCLDRLAAKEPLPD